MLGREYPAGDASSLLLAQPNLGVCSMPLNIFKWVGISSHLLQTCEGLTVSGKSGLFFMAPSD